MIRFLKIIAAGAAVVSLSACIVVIRDDDDEADFARRAPAELAPVATDEAVDESAEKT